MNKNNFLFIHVMTMFVALTFGVLVPENQKISLRAELNKPLIINIPDLGNNGPVSGCLLQNIKDPDNMSMNIVYYFAYVDDNQLSGAIVEGDDITYNGAGGNCSLIINNVSQKFVDEWKIRTEYKENLNLTGQHHFQDTNILIHL